MSAASLYVAEVPSEISAIAGLLALGPGTMSLSGRLVSSCTHLRELPLIWMFGFDGDGKHSCLSPFTMSRRQIKRFEYNAGLVCSMDLLILEFTQPIGIRPRVCVHTTVPG